MAKCSRPPNDIRADEIIFSEATPEQCVQVWSLNASVWATPLSITDYITQEGELSKQPATGSRWKTWILTSAEQPGDIISSLETMERTMLLKNAAGVHRAKIYGIASVFTNPKYRGRGMGRLLLERLKAWLDEQDAWGSILFSDIDPHFYGRVGWECASTRTLLLSRGHKGADEVRSRRALRTVKYLHECDLEDLCDRDVGSFEGRCLQDVEAEAESFAILPTLPWLLWHVKRQELCERLVLRKPGGALRVGVMSPSRRAWVLWHLDYAERKVKILRIVLLDMEQRSRNVRELADLMKATVEIADEAGCDNVVIWSPGQEVEVAVGNLMGELIGWTSTMEDRTYSAPMIRKRFGNGEGTAVPVHLEYHAWC